MPEYLVFHEQAFTEFSEKGIRIKKYEYIELSKILKSQTLVVTSQRLFLHQKVIDKCTGGDSLKLTIISPAKMFAYTNHCVYQQNTSWISEKKYYYGIETTAPSDIIIQQENEIEEINGELKLKYMQLSTEFNHFIYEIKYITAKQLINQYSQAIKDKSFQPEKQKQLNLLYQKLESQEILLQQKIEAKKIQYQQEIEEKQKLRELKRERINRQVEDYKQLLLQRQQGQEIVIEENEKSEEESDHVEQFINVSDLGYSLISFRGDFVYVNYQKPQLIKLKGYFIRNLESKFEEQEFTYQYIENNEVCSMQITKLQLIEYIYTTIKQQINSNAIIELESYSQETFEMLHSVFKAHQCKLKVLKSALLTEDFEPFVDGLTWQIEDLINPVIKYVQILGEKLQKLIKHYLFFQVLNKIYFGAENVYLMPESIEVDENIQHYSLSYNEGNLVFVENINIEWSHPNFPFQIINPDWLKTSIVYSNLDIYQKKNKTENPLAPGDFVVKCSGDKAEFEIQFGRSIKVKNELVGVSNVKICHSVRVEVDMFVEVKDFWYEVPERNRHMMLGKGVQNVRYVNEEL